MRVLRLGIEITQINKGILKGVLANSGAFARFSLPQDDGLGRGSRKLAVEPHNLLDRGLTEKDAIVFLQVPLPAKPAGIAVFFLNWKHRLQGAYRCFPAQPVRPRGTVLPPTRFGWLLLGFLRPAP